MKASKGIEGLVAFIAYQPLSNDEAVERFLDESIDDTEYKSGMGSRQALAMRRMVSIYRHKMRVRGPDHGVSIDEKGDLKYREPH